MPGKQIVYYNTLFAGKSLTKKETAWKMARLPVFGEGQEFHPVVLGQAEGDGFIQDLIKNICFLG